MFWDGAARRSPSRPRPDLIAMQSSLVSKWQPSIRTPLQDSGSQPSSFGPWLATVTSRIVTLRLSIGWMVQNGAFRTVTPSIRTLVQLWGSMKCGRR